MKKYSGIKTRDLNIDGYSIHLASRACDDEPAQPPLLIFNGIGANLEVMFPLMQALGRLHTVIFDIPGVGASKAPLLPPRLTGLAQLSEDILSYLDIPVADVLGMSWGGLLAQQFAHQFPGHCRRLVLAATSPGTIMVPGRVSVMFALTNPMRFLDADYLRRYAGDIYGGQLRNNPALVDEYLALARPPKTPLGYYWQLYASAGWTSIHWLHTLRQPTLILTGRNDPLLPLENARLLHLHIPDSRLIELDDGHLFLFGLRDLVAKLIKSFLSNGQSL